MKYLLRPGLAAVTFFAFAPTTVHAECRSWQPCSPHRYRHAETAPEISTSRMATGIALSLGVALIAGFSMRRRPGIDN